MNILVKPLLWLLKKCLESLFKQVKKETGYIIRSSKGIYIKMKDDEWKDIVEETCAGPIGDEILEMIEDVIEKIEVPVKYRCTKCQETLVDNENELTPFGGLGNWCEICISNAE